MKILKIFGIVVGIHVFALVLIFANPGCSSSTKPAPSPGDTVSTSTPGTTPSTTPAASTPPPSVPPQFNPDAPAMAEPSASVASASPTVRFTPTRPGTPVATAIVAEPVADVTPVTTYTVKSGESLWTIARKHHLTVPQLTAANSLQSNAVLKPGQKLIIPGKPSSPTASAPASTAPAPAPSKAVETAASRPAASGGGTVKHTVKSGETLGSIARTYGVKHGDIAVANNISDPAKIRPGMELVIPGWQAPGSKSGKAASKSGKSTPAPAPAPAPAEESTPPPTAPSTPPTINFDAPGLTPPPSSPTQVPTVPVIPIEESPIRPAPKSQ